jgi:PIN domain nuclease of toxin-antitoxin system
MSLPDHHRDRYCRILMAQALEEDMVIVTRDAAIARYAVPTLLA